jgi:hypothetical protein
LIPDDITNYQLVSAASDDIAVLRPKTRMTKHEALVHAAWLVTLTGMEDNFPAILQQVQNT